MRKLSKTNCQIFLNEVEKLLLSNGYRATTESDFFHNTNQFVLESNKLGKIYFRPVAETIYETYSVFGRFENPNEYVRKCFQVGITGKYNHFLYNDLKNSLIKFRKVIKFINSKDE